MKKTILISTCFISLLFFIFILSSLKHDNVVTITYNYGLSGRLEPCGCSSSKLGGLAQCSSLYKSLRKKNSTIVLDGGNLIDSTNVLDYNKFCTTIKIMDYLGYSAVGIGSNELCIEPEKLSKATMKVSFTLVSANVFSKYKLNRNSKEEFQYTRFIETHSSVNQYLESSKYGSSYHLFASPAVIIQYPGYKIGVTAFTNVSNQSSFSDNYVVIPPKLILQGLINKLHNDCDYVIVMFDGEYKDIIEYVDKCKRIDLYLSGVTNNFAIGSGAVVNYESNWGNTNDKGKYLIICDVKKTLIGWNNVIHYEDVKSSKPDEYINKLIKSE